MKFFRYIVFLLTLACTKEQAIPVVVDFDLVVVEEDYSVPVQVKVLNKTTGADAYNWTIEGSSSTLAKTSRSPGTIVYDEEGTYTVKLYASNQDGEEDSKEVSVQIFSTVHMDFEVAWTSDHFAPAEAEMTNLTTGATFYQWYFEGGQPEFSDAKDPGKVIFAEPGDHTITLTAGNGFEEFTRKKTITVAPDIIADFDWEVAFEDDDYQAPVTLTMNNNSISATTYKWIFEGGVPETSTTENPTVTFETTGMHTITLEATNGKETITATKTVEIYPNTNLRTFEDIQLGINTAHNAHVIGAFFSTKTRERYNKEQVNGETGPDIDLVFFGLDGDFSFNKFVAPDKVAGETTFAAIPGATHTKFINSQEQCGCSASLSADEFDAMTDDTPLQALAIEETNGGLQHFNGEMVPRVVLFETADGRKGAIKIKIYHPQGSDSYITADIKVQKEKM